VQASYSVFPNFTPAARTGVATFAGQTFTVTQAGNPLNADQRFVQLLYFSFFGRLPSQTELDFQVTNGLGPGPNKDYAQLAMNFLNSPEFNIGGRFIAGLYVGLLDRNAEYSGWLFQRNAMINRVVDPLGLIANFLNGDEYELRFGNPSNEEFVRLLYRYILLREASPSDVQFQASQLAPAGNLTRAQLASNFLNSPEFRQGTGARLTAFLLYATLLQRDPSPADLQFRMNQLANATQATVKALVADFINTPEFRAVVGW
jgi:hypothetical protein